VGWPGNKKRKAVPMWEHIHAEKAKSAWGEGAKEIRLTVGHLRRGSGATYGIAWVATQAEGRRRLGWAAAWCGVREGGGPWWAWPTWLG
jgi:hypothetical protein